MSSLHRIVSCSFLAVVLSAQLGCDREPGDWSGALAQNTQEGYEQFYAKHPDSKNASRAMAEIWRITKARNKQEAFEAFLAKYPKTRFADEALNEIWRLAKERDTMAGYQAFLGRHPQGPLSQAAGAAMARLWSEVTPAPPRCSLTSNLSVALEWDQVEGAQSYVVNWSQEATFRPRKEQSEATASTSLTRTERVGEYEAKLPMYYRVTAVRDSVPSKPSKAAVAALKPSNNGRFCEICGGKAVGYCHLRAVHVCGDHDTFVSDSGQAWRCP